MARSDSAIVTALYVTVAGAFHSASVKALGIGRSTAAAAAARAAVEGTAAAAAVLAFMLLAAIARGA